MIYSFVENVPKKLMVSFCSAKINKKDFFLDKSDLFIFLFWDNSATLLLNTER
jgi:hypothetical protein